MRDEGYKGGTSVESKWGCFTAAIVCGPLFFFLILLDALGDCAPEPTCKKGFLPFVLMPTGVVAAALYFGVWFVVNRIRPQSKDG